jgi:predicted Zn-dependent peptidase
MARLTALALLEGAMGADAPTGRAYGLERVATPSVHVRHDSTIFGLTVTTTDVDVAIDRLRDMLLQPGFRLSAFQRAQRLAPRLIAADRFTTGLEGALYAVPGAEDERELGALEAWHCRAFHKATYDLHRATVVWVGDITLPQARKLTERLVSGSSSKPTANAVAPVPPAVGLDLKHEGRMHVAVVTKGPARSHEDWPALWLVAQSMTKSCPALPWASPVESFRICDTVASTEVDTWKRSVESQLVAIGRGGLEPALLETAKRRLIEEEAVRLRSPDALADTLTRWSLSNVDVVGDRVRDVTDVRDAVVRHLATEHLRFVAVPVTEDGRSSADSSP